MQKDHDLEELVAKRTKDLEEVNSFINAVLENLVDGVITIDSKGNIRSINKAVTSIFGYNETELLGKNISILMPEPFHSQHDGYLENYLNTGKAKILNIGREVLGKRKNGEIFPLYLSVTEIKLHGIHYFTGLVRDISERVAMQQQIQVQQERYEHSQVFANIGTWDWNIQTGDLYWSDQIAPLFGFPKGELETTYDNFLASVHPDDRQKVIDAVNACVETGAEYYIEHRCVWPDGSVRWLLEKGDVTRADDGTPLHMLGVVQDITDQKLAEAELADKAELLKESQLIGKIGNWSLDIATGNLQWSDEIYRIFGYHPNEFSPSYERFFAAVHPDDVEKIKHSEKEAFDHNKSHSIDHRIVLPTGEIRWVHEEAYTTYDDNNKAIKLSGTVQDITERKSNEHKLILTNEILHQIASGDDVQFILDNIISGVEKLLPNSICSILIVEDDKLYKRGDNRLPDFYNQAIDGLEVKTGNGVYGTTASQNRRIIVPDIFSHPYTENFTELAEKAGLASCWSEPIRSLSNKPFGTFTIYHRQPKTPDMNELDISYSAAKLASIAFLREQNENSLEKAKNDAVKASEAKSEFLSRMSHELRTPLNAIIGFSQLLKTDNKLNTDQKDSINEIYEAGNHLLLLINDVLDISKIETGNIKIEEEVINLGNIINTCIQLTEEQAKNKCVTLEIQDDIDYKDITILADATRLKQSLLNLLSNAIKYNVQEGRVYIYFTKPGKDHIQINIEDSGIGISEEDQLQLFTPFNRLSAEKYNIDGTGIGLFITKQLVELMGGSILVNSKPGNGSTFSIVLPVASSTHMKIDNIHVDSLQDENIAASNKTIVYIEDNITNQKIVEKYLQKRSNITLLSAMEAKTGIALIKKSQPDLILLDINLPGMSGFDIIKLLKKDNTTSQIPVVAVSAHAMSSDLEKGLEAGFDEYLTKPLDLSRFNDVLDNYLS